MLIAIVAWVALGAFPFAFDEGSTEKLSDRDMNAPICALDMFS